VFSKSNNPKVLSRNAVFQKIVRNSLFQYYCLLQLIFLNMSTLLIQERWTTLILLIIELYGDFAIVVYWAGHW
jgi:hypothetical protein